MKGIIKVGLFLVLVAAMLYWGACALAEPQSGTCGAQGDNLSWTVDDEGTLTISGAGPMQDFSSHDPPWGNGVKAIVIENGVINIGKFAFQGCENALEITIPDSVTGIGYGAFGGCNSLTGIIANGKRIVFEGVSSSGNYGSNISWIEGANGVLFIYGLGEICDANSALLSFHWSTSIHSAVIYDGVTSIGTFAFKDCRKLSDLTIPSSITSIRHSAFENCIALNCVYAPSLEAWLGISYILNDNPCRYGAKLFIDGVEATHVNIPHDVTSIGKYAFQGCNSLTRITLPNGLSSIGYGAFMDCVSLEEITIPDSVSSIEGYAFSNCPAKRYANIGSDASKALSRSMYSFRIPDSNYDLWYPNAYHDSFIELNVVSSDDDAACVTIQEGVTCIGDNAFSGCVELTEINIPDGVTDIGNGVFSGCEKLTEIVIPESVIHIGNNAFLCCSSLGAISLPTRLSRISDFTFSGCTSLSSVTLPIGLTAIDSCAFSCCNSLSSIEIPDSVTSIGGSAFASCTNLQSIVLPSSVTSIGHQAFFDCTNLASIALPTGLTDIGDGVFSQCTSLSTIEIPDSVTNIGSSAFTGCTGLATVTIPASVTSIGSEAFFLCSNLSKVAILSDERDPLIIDQYAFKRIRPAIYCYMFSPADSWCSQNGFTPIYLDDIDIDTIRTVTLPEDFRLACGDSQKIEAGVFPAMGDAVTWTSSAPSVASVADGVVTAHAPGEAVITATVGDVSDSVTVQTYIAATGFALNESELWVLARNQVPLSVASWEPEGATREITWRNSDTDLATVDASGLVATIKPGDVTITATSERGISRECLIHQCYPVTAVAFDPETVVLKDGQTQQLTASVTARTQNFVNKLVSFESSNADAATVDAAGLVTARGLGTATITATAASGKSASCKVVVTNRASVLTLPANLTAIEAEAFMGDTAIEAVIVPEGCGAIGAKAFAGCVNLVYVKVPAGTSVADDAFEGCGNVTIERAE